MAARRDEHEEVEARPPSLRVRLFGELDLQLDHTLLPAPASSRARSLLAYLVLHRDGTQARQRVAFLLWPDSTESQARTNLRNALHLLRRAVPEIDRSLEVTSTTLRWREGFSWVDVHEFRAAMSRAQAARPCSVEQVAALREALALYGGDLLEDCYDEWLAEDRERLRDQCVSALRLLTEALAARGEHVEAMRTGRELTRRDPLNEDHHRLLLGIHAATGDRAGAMRVYHECAALLRRELGVGPSAATHRAYVALIRAEDPGEEKVPGTAARNVLVGREAEWAVLTRCWREAEGGRSHLLLLTGEPGIGKTVLADELASWCARRGALVGRSRSYPTEGELGYGTVISWLRTPEIAAPLRRATGLDAIELRRLLPELGPSGEPATGEVGELDRMRLFDAVARALTASGRPMLLVADDAHWCDGMSLQLLHFLVRRESASALVVVATARREELDQQHPLAALSNGLQVLDRATEVPLDRLSRAGTAELAVQLLGGTIDEATADSLYAETEGNPLFVAEMIRAGFDRARPDQGLSPKLQAVIDGRLRQLPEPVRHLLGVAATVGRDFTAQLVGRAAGLDDLALVRGLDELWRRGVVRAHDADAYDFSHGKIRDAAYEALSPATRQLNHRLVAEALVALHEHDLDAVSGQVAVSYDRAGRAPDAVAWYQRAAAQARRLYADVEAVRLLERALTLAATLPERPGLQQELAILTALPTALVGVEGYASDRQAALQRRAAEVARTLGAELEPPLLRSLVMSRLCRDDFDGARDAAERLRVAARRDGDHGLEVESEYLLGIGAFWAGELAAANDHFEQVVARFQADQTGEHVFRFGHDPKVTCLGRLANTLWFLGRGQDARRVREEALALAAQTAHPITSAVTRLFAAVLSIDLEEPHDVRRFVASLGREDHHSRILELNAAALDGYVEVVDGRDGGIERIRRAIADAGPSNPAPSFKAVLMRLLVAACAAADDVPAGLVATGEALRLGGTRLWEPEIRRLRAVFLARDGGGVAEIEAELTRALELAEAQGALAPRRRIERSRSRLLPVD